MAQEQKSNRKIAEDIATLITVGRPLVVILNTGRENAIVVEQITAHYLAGKVPVMRNVCLYEPTGRGNKLSIMIDTAEIVHKECYKDPGLVLFNQPCLFYTLQPMAIKVDDISVWEESIRHYFAKSPLKPDRTLDEDALVQVIPELAKFHAPTGGFFVNPALAGNPPEVINRASKVIDIPAPGAEPPVTNAEPPVDDFEQPEVNAEEADKEAERE